MNVTLTRALNSIFGMVSHLEMLEEGNIQNNQ